METQKAETPEVQNVSENEIACINEIQAILDKYGFKIHINNQMIVVPVEPQNAEVVEQQSHAMG